MRVIREKLDGLSPSSNIILRDSACFLVVVFFPEAARDYYKLLAYSPVLDSRIVNLLSPR